MNAREANKRTKGMEGVLDETIQQVVTQYGQILVNAINKRIVEKADVGEYSVSVNLPCLLPDAGLGDDMVVTRGCRFMWEVVKAISPTIDHKKYIEKAELMVLSFLKEYFIGKGYSYESNGPYHEPRCLDYSISLDWSLKDEETN